MEKVVDIYVNLTPFPRVPLHAVKVSPHPLSYPSSINTACVFVAAVLPYGKEQAVLLVGARHDGHLI